MAELENARLLFKSHATGFKQVFRLVKQMKLAEIPKSFQRQGLDGEV